MAAKEIKYSLEERLERISDYAKAIDTMAVGIHTGTCTNEYAAAGLHSLSESIIRDIDSIIDEII